MTYERSLEISDLNPNYCPALKDIHKGWILWHKGSKYPFKWHYRNSQYITDEKVITILKQRTDWRVLNYKFSDPDKTLDVGDFYEGAISDRDSGTEMDCGSRR